MQKILIVSSCTKSKVSYPCEPIELYTGDGHQKVRDAVAIFSRKGIEVGWKILSAGLGLLNPRGQKYPPYDKTFLGKKQSEIIEMSNELKIPQFMDEAISNYDVIIFALGKEYVSCIQFNKLKNLSTNKTLIFIDSQSSWKSNLKMYESLKNVNAFDWLVTEPTNWGQKISFRGDVLRYIANDVSNINDLNSKYFKDLIMESPTNIKLPKSNN